MPKKQHPIYSITRSIKDTGEHCPKLQQILDDHMAIFAKSKGSQNNHQAWEGGYLQHVADAIQIAGGLCTHSPWPLPFSRSSVVLVMFLHDIEKPFMQHQMAADKHMPLWSKRKRHEFRSDLIAKYDIQLTAEESTALLYIEGEGDDYNPTKRMMNELGALCHSADIMSARLWPNRNKPE